MLHFTSRAWSLMVSMLLSCTMQGQIVNTSCTFDQSFSNKYAEGSWNSAYNYLNSIDSGAFTLQPVIEPALHDTIMACIAAVFNTNLPARDTVFAQLDITQFKPIDLLRIELRFDTSHGWTNQFLAGNTTSTSNSFINALAQQYGFVLESVQYMPAWVQTHDAEARVRIAAPHNTNALARIMAMQAGILTANAVTPSGDGNQIIYSTEGNINVLTFRYGWEDCPAGCIYQRDWRFRIFNDCSVEFVASYGDLLATTAIHSVFPTSTFSISPNPAQSWFSLSLHSEASTEAYQVQLMNMQGKVVYAAITELQAGKSERIPVDHLADGIYLLQIQGNSRSATQKVIISH